MNLFKINGELAIDTSNVYVNGIKADLSVCNISQADYERPVAEDKCEDNMLYVVDVNCINAYGQNIVNVAEPIDMYDAATKSYVDKAVAQLSGIDVPKRLSQLDNDMDYVTREEAYDITKTVLRTVPNDMLKVEIR